MTITEIFLNKLDKAHRDQILMMKASPQEQALYLFNLYEGEASQLAADCSEIFSDMQDQEGVDYWKQVSSCLATLMIKH